MKTRKHEERDNMPKENISKIMEKLYCALEASDRPLSTSEVAEKAGVGWRTAEKYLSLLWLLGIRGRIRLVADKGNMKLWWIEERGLGKIPDEEQRIYLRMEWPKPEVEDAILVTLHQKGSATIEEIRYGVKFLLERELKSSEIQEALDQLLRQEAIIRIGEKIRLTEFGEKRVKQTLWLYPELKKTITLKIKAK